MNNSIEKPRYIMSIHMSDGSIKNFDKYIYNTNEFMFTIWELAKELVKENEGSTFFIDSIKHVTPTDGYAREAIVSHCKFEIRLTRHEIVDGRNKTVNYAKINFAYMIKVNSKNDITMENENTKEQVVL